MRKSKMATYHEIMSLRSAPPLINLPDNGDGGGGYVCFICDGTIKRGESFTCVNRQLEILESEHSKKRIVEAVATLQVCLPCTLLSSCRQLEWASRPKLTDTELQGFNVYARTVAHAVSREKSDTRVEEELARSLLADSRCLSIELDMRSLVGGVHHINPVSLTSRDRCQRCQNVIIPERQHVAFETSMDKQERGLMNRTNVWRLGEYCPACSGPLLPLCDRVW